MSRRSPGAASAWPTIALCLATVATARGAADPVPEGGTVPSDPVFKALRIDGTTTSGRIRQLGPKEELTLVSVEGPEQVIPLDRLVKLSREGGAPASATEGAVVLFPDGDRLYGGVVGAADETNLKVLSSTLGDLAIPLESILGLVLKLPTVADEADALLSLVRSAPRETELLWLANGDLLAGGYLGLDEKAIKFQREGGPIDLERSGVVALGFDPALVDYPRPEGTYLELALADGSRLGVTAYRVEQGQVVATTRFGAHIRLPLGELTSVHSRSASIAYLSEREATAQQYESYVGPTRPYRRDAAVTGHPLRVAGQTFDHGLGTQSRTLLAYQLAPGDRRFQALVGLDDRAGPQGSVVFRVLVEGRREKFASPPMSVRDAPIAIDVDITGSKVLILVAEFGPRGDVRDYADWIEARIIR
jgi:hypothetical protein